eukprot:6183837-Pleurochrysis_carterae.AAC.2
MEIAAWDPPGMAREAKRWRQGGSPCGPHAERMHCSSRAWHTSQSNEFRLALSGHALQSRVRSGSSEPTCFFETQCPGKLATTTPTAEHRMALQATPAVDRSLDMR